MELIKNYKKALQELKVLEKEGDKEREIHEKKAREIYNKYYELKDKLETRERKEKNAEEEKFNKIKENIEKRTKPFIETRGNVLEILSLIKVFRKNYNTHFEVYTSDKDEKGNYISDKRKIVLNPFEILEDDEFKKIAVYLVENGKPVNKFSLIIRGRSIFGYSDEFNKFRYGSYITGTHDEGCNIEKTLKDLPTEEGLKTWYSKNKENLLKDFKELQKQIEEKYKEAIELYKSKGWKILFLENEKDYYENHYCGGTETKEYKQVIKELKTLKG